MAKGKSQAKTALANGIKNKEKFQKLAKGLAKILPNAAKKVAALRKNKKASPETKSTALPNKAVEVPVKAPSSTTDLK